MANHLKASVSFSAVKSALLDSVKDSRKSMGAVTIFEIIPLALIIFGIVFGVKLGSRYGDVAAGIGAVVGGVLGLFCWRLPLYWTATFLDRKRDFSRKTVEELRAMLRDPNCRVPNVVLLELAKRGQNMKQELPLVFDMLTSPLPERRYLGRRTLVSVFPERARLVGNYRADESVEKCKEKVWKILIDQE